MGGRRGGEQHCGHVLGLLDARIAEIDQPIADLTALRQSLRTACSAAKARQRSGQTTVVCRIIEDAVIDKQPLDIKQ